MKWCLFIIKIFILMYQKQTLNFKIMYAIKSKSEDHIYI